MSAKNSSIFRLALVAASAFSFAAVTLPSSTAEAAPEVLRPGTRPWWFAGGLGPSFRVTNGCGSRGRGRGGCGFGFTQFMLTQEIGYHFSGDFEGPALGAHITEAFGAGLFRFSVQPRFWYDIKIVDDLGLYITPDAGLGYTGFFGGGGTHLVNIRFGAAGRLVLGDRGMVFVRAADFDINFNGDGALLLYSLLLGGGVIW